MRFTPFFIYRFLLPFLAILFLNACVNDVCEIKSDPQLRLAFVKITDEKEAPFPVAFTKVSAKGATTTNDSLNATQTAISGIRLPLSPKEPTTTFIFSRDNLTNDEITLTYNPKPYFISQACGFEIRYEDISIVSHTENNIDAVIVLQPSVNAQINDVNIKVYFKK